MTENPPHSSADAAGEQAQVAAYLRSHPDFFNFQPELLQSLTLPHDSGQAVSLWERQVATLREENEKLKSRFEVFLTSARENQQLIARIHRLALALLAAVGPHSIFKLLQQGLADDFKAERVTLLIFAQPSAVDSADLTQFVGRDSARRAPFAALLAAGDSVCGHLSLAQTQALFAGGEFRGSHVVLPLVAAQWDGVIAISSADSARFDAEMGTEFLAFLRDVTALVVAPWVAKLRPA